jgi:hypothetical protein
MTHAIATVFVPEGKTLNEVMAPFDEEMSVEPYERPCWCTEERASIKTPDCDECDHTGIETTTYNPHSKWDWFVRADDDDSRYKDFNPGEPTYALVLPDEGWQARGDLGWFGSSANEIDGWDDVFRMAFERYSQDPTLTVVLVDYHI